MSAFIVPKAHIDALVTAGLEFAQPRGLTWFWPRITEQDRLEPDENGICRDRHRELTSETATRVGAMLWQENWASVSYRYQDDDELPGAINDGEYTFSRLPGNFRDPRVPNQVLGALSCYTYQSCEHPHWPDSEANAFCEALQRLTIRRLPGHDDAVWTIYDRRFFVDLTASSPGLRG